MGHGRSPGELQRRALLLPHDLVLDVEQKILDLSRHGRRVSFSAFAEVSLRRLLEAPDIAATLSSHGAAARRPSVKREQKR
jgi:hypothetical protein